MHNKKIPTGVGTIVLIIIAVTVFGVVWKYEKNQQDTQQSLVIANIKKPIATQVPIISKQNKDITDANNWQTYIDNKLDYTMKYPEGYVIQKYNPPCNSKINNEDGQNVVVWISDYINKNYDAYSNDIENGNIVSFNIFINDPSDECIRNAYSSVGGPQSQIPKLLSSENIFIKKHSVLKRTYAHLDPEGKLSVFHFSTWRFSEGGKYFTLMFNNGIQITNPKKQDDLFENFIENFNLK